MSVKSFLQLAALAVMASACGKVESHELRLTHPPIVFGEYVTQTASTADFAGLEVDVPIPGRRPEYSKRSIKDNVVLANRRQAVVITLSNPGDQTALAPQVVTVAFYDGPTGELLEVLNFTSEVIPPGGQITTTLETAQEAPSGTYYWSYQIDLAEGWEMALESWAEASAAAELDADDDWDGDGDDEWEDEDW